MGPEKLEMSPAELMMWQWDSGGNADSGKVKRACRGRITLSSPRWSRLRYPELVAGSGKHVVVVVVAVDDTWESI